MPLAAACRGARAAAAAPPLRSRRGAEEGSAPARRLREAEVKTAKAGGRLKREINCAEVSLASTIKGYFWYFLIEVEAAFFL